MRRGLLNKCRVILTFIGQRNEDGPVKGIEKKYSRNKKKIITDW